MDNHNAIINIRTTASGIESTTLVNLIIRLTEQLDISTIIFLFLPL